MVWSILTAIFWLWLRVYLISFAFAMALIGVLSLSCKITWKPIEKYQYYIKFVLVYVVFFCSSVFLSPIFLLKPRNVINSQYSAVFVKAFTEVLGVTTEVRNSHILEEDRGALVCLNHQSAMDNIVLFLLIPILKLATPVIKKELLYAVPFGPCTWLCGSFFIDRKSPESAYRTLNHCATEMKKKKIKCYMFPEGTRSPTRGLLPFKRGAFKTAIMGQVPIIPVVLSPYYFIDHKTKTFGQGHIIVKALDAISTEGMVDADHEALMEKTRALMLDEYMKLAQEIDEMSQKADWVNQKRPRIVTDGKKN